MPWYRWSGYFRGEHTETKWHYAASWSDEFVLCGVRSRAALAAQKDDPKRSRCHRCEKKLGGDASDDLARLIADSAKRGPSAAENRKVARRKKRERNRNKDMSKDFDFAGARKQAEKEGKIPGGFFKVENGSNRIRLVSRCLPDESVFEKDGKKERRFKWLCFVLDRRDGIVKPYGMPHRVYKDIEALQQSEDYAFDTIPMPYDVDIVVENAGTIQARYKVNAARKNADLTADEQDAIAEKGGIDEFRQQLRGGHDFDPDEVPI